ncbi:MAG: TetR/AcrR family transcriptional regulator [Alphaproteobacteria bacterium]|nr:TetR/AcrR family transcriptional regulator [Alphaproteobacteria bacterium]
MDDQGDSRAHETTERILDAALPLFASLGFAGASTRRLAAAAGVNISTLAYHFGDKQGLYDAVVDRIYDRLLDLPLPADDALGPTPAARLRALVALLYGQARDNADGIRLLLRHVMEHQASPEAVRGRWTATVMGRVGEILASLPLRPGVDLRLALLSLNHLVARYAVTEPEDLLPFVPPGQDPHQAVAEHLGALACTLLGVPD